MVRSIAIFSTALVAAVGCTRTTVSTAGGELGAAVPVNARRLPVGTELVVRTNDKLGGSANHVGDRFATTVTEPVIARNGAVVIPEGAMVFGRITGLHNAPSVGSESVIRLDFDRLRMNGRDYPFDAVVDEVKAPAVREETLKKAGIGALAGAGLGAIITGGHLQGLLTGGILGAAAGTVVSLGTDARRAELPEGTRMRLRSTRSVTFR
jgi:hypothetical protein